MRAILILVGLSMILATLLPLIRRDDWWIRIFDFPRLQITALLSITLAAYLFFREKPGPAEHVFLAALALSLAYQAYRMYPYTPLARKQVQSSRAASEESSISLLFANVLMTNRKADLLRKLIHEADPDVILTVEIDAWWEEQLAELARTHPYIVRQPQDNTYGMLLFSRLSLSNTHVKRLVDEDVPSIHTRVALRCGQEIELRCLHPRPPAPQESDRSTERDAELIIVGREMKEKNAPGIVLGDLNDVAWSRTSDLFQSISGLLDPRVGRGFFHTFNAKCPLIRFPLDHVFHSPHFRLTAFKRLARFGSDHFPVYIKLSFEPSAQVRQQPDPATPQEQGEAQAKVEEAR